MSVLLDVNVLVALFDGVHIHHEAAHEWFADHRKGGWASCPITENGMIRVLSNPAYPGRQTSVRDAIEGLARFRESGDHMFWTDSVSLCDNVTFHLNHIGGHRQLTDVYLLALAVQNHGRLATFDRNIPLSVVKGGNRHIEILGSA